MIGSSFSTKVAPRFMLFITEATSFLTLAQPSSAPIVVVIEALHHHSVHNEELTFPELPVMQQAFLNKKICFPKGSHLNRK
jgi:hypothetical protein